MEKVDLKKVCGISVRIPCDYCKGTGRVPGGKYKHEGEVISCPVCNHHKTTAVVITMEQFRTLMTLTANRAKPRTWRIKKKSAGK